MDEIGVVILVVGQADQHVEFTRDLHPDRDGIGVMTFPGYKTLNEV